MTDLRTPTVNLIGNGPLPAKQVVVLRSLRCLGQIVATRQWCLIGGLMVEILLISRGASMLRPTDDGDIIGDVVADRSVLRKLGRGLIDMGFEELPAGRAGNIGVRFREPTSGAFIDILAPEASLRLRRVVPTQSDKRALEAPGTDVAIETATEVSVTYAAERTTAHHPCAVSPRCHLRESDGMARDQECTRLTEASARRSRPVDRGPSRRTP